MSHDTTVARRQVEITNSLGLHLRPADKFVKLALRYQAEIRVHYNGNQFNGKSILDLTTLAAECGTRLELEARGPDAEAGHRGPGRPGLGPVLRERERRRDPGPSQSRSRPDEPAGSDVVHAAEPRGANPGDAHARCRVGSRVQGLAQDHRNPGMPASGLPRSGPRP